MKTYQVLFSDGLTQFAAADEYHITDGRLVFQVKGVTVASYQNSEVVSLNDLGASLVSDDLRALSRGERLGEPGLKNPYFDQAPPKQ